MIRKTLFPTLFLALALSLALAAPLAAQGPQEVEVEGVLVHRLMTLEEPAGILSAALTLESEVCALDGEGVLRCPRLTVVCGPDLAASCWELPFGDEVRVVARLSGDGDGEPRLTVVSLR